MEDKIIVAPFGSTTITKNSLKQEIRNYPIDLVYRKAKKFQSSITIPDAYKLLKIPSNYIENNKMVKIVYTLNIQIDNLIQVIGMYKFKKDTYESSEYILIKDYFNKIVDKFNERLILVKK